MLQVIQSLKDGTTEVIEVPSPAVKPEHLLIRTSASLISSGTEKMLMEFGKANLLNKARLQPDKVRQVLNKIRSNGVVSTLNSIQAKLSQPIPLGYCNAGVVIAVGEGVSDFSVGDRVISNGAHAQIVCVPKHLCAKIPAAVPELTDEEACFTVLGAIALQGIRLINPTLGETFVVQGLGVIGLLTVQLLKANGCQVLAMDFDDNKLKLAAQFGANTFNLSHQQDPSSFALLHTQGRGVDGAILTAATQSSEPVRQAANMCRKRGRIILVGVTGLSLNRADFYEKELSFQVSCSYGPGRYDHDYEQGGKDYPYGLVRWTEQRNFEAVLQQLQNRNLNVSGLISKKFQITEATRAYSALEQEKSLLGIILEFPTPHSSLGSHLNSRTVNLKATNATATYPTIGILGSGSYCHAVLLPHLKKTKANIQAICSQRGLSATIAAKDYNIPTATTDASVIFENRDINTVFITTRHDSHASLVLQALKAGKHIYVEKPLALHFEELIRIETMYRELLKKGRAPIVCVGFNRRFSPLTTTLKNLLGQITAPKSAIITINADPLPHENWQNDPKSGGGRIVGEACHFIDLLRFLINQPITNLTTQRMGNTTDNSSLHLQFADGSMGTIHYLSNGHRNFPKERIEIFSERKIAVMDNFKSLRTFGFSGFGNRRLFTQNKGNRECFAAFLEAIKLGGPSPIPFLELLEVSRYAVQAQSYDTLGELKLPQRLAG